MTRFFAACMLSTASLVAATQADASIWVDFTLVGTPLEPGTVTGRLEFAGTGTNVQAVAAYITSADRVPYDPTVNLFDILTVTRSNAFTLASDGTVTAATLQIQQFFAAPSNEFLELNAFGGYNDYEIDTNYSGVGVTNQAGFGGVTYTVESAASVPEPASWAMMIGGFGMIGGALRRRNAVRIAFA